MIMMAIINGSEQIVNYALSIMGWFSIIFPRLSWSRDKPSLFTRWKDERNHGRRRGVHGKFLHILVQEFAS